MGALDQAFIKAYHQPGPVSAAAPLPSDGSVPLGKVSPDISDDLTLAMEPSTDLDSPAGDMLHALENVSASVSGQAGLESDVPSDPETQQPEEGGSTEVASEESFLDRTAQDVLATPSSVRDCGGLPSEPVPGVVLDGMDATDALPGVHLNEVSLRVDSGASVEPPREADHSVVPPPHTATLMETGPATADHEPNGQSRFVPMLQVDEFRWPKACIRLREQASEQMGRLADWLQGAARRGNQLVGIGSRRHGEGATTLLLCAAKCLVDRGVGVIIVDADPASAKLAQRVGLLPDLGFEDVLTGQARLEEVVIESTTDRLAILPLRETSGHTADLRDADPRDADPKDVERRVAEAAEALRNNYELTLLDLPTLQDPTAVDDLLADGVGSRLDAVILVHNVNAEPQRHVVELRHYLTAAGVRQTGVIQNFVHA